MPPQSSYRGHTYSEWSARFFQWVYSLPTDHHPLFDNADCSTGQTGDVWFIDGKFGGDAPFPPGGRNCTIPPGTALFLTLAAANRDDTACDELNNIQPTNDPVSVLREKAETGLNQFLDSRVIIIDGVAVKGLPACNPDDPSTCQSPYRVQSPVFDYINVPAFNNIVNLGLESGSCYTDPTGTGASFTVPGAVADGVYVIIKPLPVGDHTIQFGIGPNGNRKYNITVGVRKKGFQ